MKNKDNKIVLIIIGAIILLGISAYFPSTTVYKPDQLTLGISAINFCSDICGGIDKLYSSNNNTQYNFTRCECVEGTSDPGSRSNYVKVYRNISYFDSYNLSNLTESEVLNRINN